MTDSNPRKPRRSDRERGLILSADAGLRKNVAAKIGQVVRVSDDTAFLYDGELIEYGLTSKLFSKPETQHTEDSITGRFG